MSELRKAIIANEQGTASKDMIDMLESDLVAWRTEGIALKLEIECELRERKAEVDCKRVLSNKAYSDYIKWRTATATLKTRLDKTIFLLASKIAEKNRESHEANRALKAEKKKEKISGALHLLGVARQIMPHNETTENWHRQVSELFED